MGKIFVSLYIPFRYTIISDIQLFLFSKNKVALFFSSFIKEDFHFLLEPFHCGRIDLAQTPSPKRGGEKDALPD